MKNLKPLPVVLFCLISSSLVSQTTQKIPLDHSVYDSWKNLRNSIVSNDGKWVSYEINPQQGDGWLYLKNISDGTLDSVPRGYQAKFSPASDFLVFKIKPQFSVTRQARKEKKKKDDMPKDSLGIWIFGTNSIEKIEKIKSFMVADKESQWIVYQHEKILPSEPEADRSEKEELTEEEKEEAKRKKEELDSLKKAKGTDLVVYNPVTSAKHQFSNITEYTLPENGALVGFIEVTGDTTDFSRVYVLNTLSEKLNRIWEQEGPSKKIVSDNDGKQVVFLHSEDTAETKIFSLYRWNGKLDFAKTIADTLNPGMPEGWCVSENADPYFSKDGSKLYFGTAPKPEPEKEDTLLDDEKYSVDVWNWKDPYLQPMQKIRIEREKNRTYRAVYLTGKNKMIQLADEIMPDLNTILKGNGDIAFGSSDLPYRKLISWEANRYRDLYGVDVLTGKRKMLLKKAPSSAFISPNGKYFVWYETADSSWYAKNISTDQMVSLTREIPFNFYNELHDSPSDPRPYGISGWIGNDEYVLVSDRYDFWKIDPSGKQKPVNLTNGFGRKNNITFRYVSLDSDEETIDPRKPMLLSAFHEFNKQSGFYRLDPGESSDPQKIIMDSYSYRIIAKAKNEDRIIFTKENFEIYPDLYVSDLNFTQPNQVSCTNPQQGEYLWGTAELVEWVSFDQQKLQGILYKPENFDPGKEYPLIVYFYERSSNGIYRHTIPGPSRSTINRPFCTSNGYLVFVPDIPYTVGYPGESAYNAVVSGTMAMINQFDYIRKDRLGLNGQSWGGYQIAYLVTRTDLFRCAFSGAPVSNMTSAYGGIRWGSGMSRMFQYEQTQSRIGGTLWEKPIHYIQNSPLFFVPKIETPLLIMHNDKDGAVPWYQGIEFFVALRRLGKPAWMLTYNGEEHNLTKWPNRKDLSVRMYQFYDYYLKDKPAPEWMVKGIPAIDKGKNDGYQFMEE